MIYEPIERKGRRRIAKPGIYLGISDEDYHDDPCTKPSLSASIAALLCRTSPAHAFAAHARLNPDFVREEKEHYDVGTAAHALLLEGLDAVDVVYFDTWRTNHAKAQRAAAYAAGRVPLLVEKWEEVKRMLDRTQEQIERFEADPPLFAAAGKPEVTIVWKERDSILCRARIDWLHDDLRAIDDFKTTSKTADPESWSRALYGMGWDIKADFYMRGLRSVTGIADADFRFVIQEVNPPYQLSALGLSEGSKWLAEAKVDYALTVWERCTKEGVWPGYPSRIAYAELPPWEEERWMQRAGRESL